MNVALFGKTYSPDDAPYIQGLVLHLEKEGGDIFIYEPFYRYLKNTIIFDHQPIIFTKQREMKGKIDFLFSIGGDGTLLDTVTLVGNTGMPIMGINMGRLGFLSSISKEEIVQAIDEIVQQKFTIDKRTLLKLETDTKLFGDLNYALNDLTVFKSTPHSMLTIKTYINDEFLNTYWADGLIVATPTGSTAYSLSCTGPIVTPQSENFVITPIASHNLTVRPIVIPDKCVIKILVDGRGMESFVSLDSRIAKIDNTIELNVKKENFKINMVQVTNQNFFRTIREKLKWGLDIRN